MNLYGKFDKEGGGKVGIKVLIPEANDAIEIFAGDFGQIPSWV